MQGKTGDRITRIVKYLGMFLTIQTFVILWAATLYTPVIKSDEPSKLFEFALTWTVVAACLFLVPRLLERVGRDWIKWAGACVIGFIGMEVLGAGIAEATFSVNDLLLPMFFIVPPLLWGVITPPPNWTLDG